jgi:outer membrane protein, heavy metal efflux system
MGRPPDATDRASTRHQLVLWVKNVTKGICRLLLLLLLLGRSLAAQPSPEQRPPDVSLEPQLVAGRLLEDYVKLAVERSPTLSALRARQSSARERVQPAGALPDPMVGLMYQSMGPPWQPMPPMSMLQGELSQAIPGIGKRQARRNAAEADVDVLRADVEATKARLAAEVRSLFAQVYASDRQQQASESAGELMDAMVGVIAGQLASGKIDQEALAKVEVERSRLREQLIDIRTNRAILVTRLNGVMDRPETATVPRLVALPDVTLELASGHDDALSQAPELRVQRAAVAAAGRRRESAEAEGRSDFLVGLAGGATTTGEPILTLRFGMELPVWHSTKQDPLIRAARSDIEASEDEYRAMELKLRSDRAELVARLRRDTEQMRLYRESIVPNAELALQAARNAYSTGRADFATVIEDFRLWLDAQVGLSRREADRLMTWAELRALGFHGH